MYANEKIITENFKDINIDVTAKNFTTFENQGSSNHCV